MPFLTRRRALATFCGVIRFVAPVDSWPTGAHFPQVLNSVRQRSYCARSAAVSGGGGRGRRLRDTRRGQTGAHGNDCQKTSHRSSMPIERVDYGNSGGRTRRLVACSNAYASAINRGSLHARPVKLTPNGAGRASKPAGNAGAGALGTIANGTITVG